MSAPTPAALAVVAAAEAIVRAEYERRFARVVARLAEIRKETGR